MKRIEHLEDLKKIIKVQKRRMNDINEYVIRISGDKLKIISMSIDRIMRELDNIISEINQFIEEYEFLEEEV